MTNLLVLGPITIDKNIYNKIEQTSIGGAVYYQSFVFENLGINYTILTTLSYEDKDLLNEFPDKSKVIPIYKNQTLYFENEYISDENRVQKSNFIDNTITWNVSRIAPNFKLIASHEALFGTKENKINTLKKYAADGEYIVLGVRHGIGQDIGHYVAYNDSSTDEIFVFDPAGNTTGKLFHDYPAMENEGTSFQVVRYKVEG